MMPCNVMDVDTCNNIGGQALRDRKITVRYGPVSAVGRKLREIKIESKTRTCCGGS